MANKDIPAGFRLFGEPAQTFVAWRPIKSDYGTALAPHDAVVYSNGYIQAAGTNDSVAGVIIATYDSDKLPVAYSPASTAGYALVCEDPDQLWIVQSDGTADLAATDIGTTYKSTSAGPVTTPAARSTFELDVSESDASANQLKLVALHRAPNNAWGDTCDVVVRFNLHAGK